MSRSADFCASPWVRGSDPASLVERSLPLERYFPPYEEGMVSKWVKQYAVPGAYILDPFGQNPFTTLELARSGYRVLVSANNPIAAFTLSVLASAPSAEMISQALLQLNQNPMRDGSSLEEYLGNFYRMDCPNPDCKATAGFEIDTFLWSEEGKQPHTAIGACTVCNFNGEVELTSGMLDDLGRTPSNALIRSQILERIAGQDPPLRRVMEEVINFYSPRALTALQILLGKIETSNLSPLQTNTLKAMWLTAADQANQLWIWPKAKNRPRQLLRPPQYQEANVWKAFLRSASLWIQPGAEVKLRNWPKRVPPAGGISLFEGRLREMGDVPEPGLIQLVQTSLPRRNQAWWNLSGLWSGWLWGKEGVKTIRNSLLKQRYDWTWHSTALKKVLGQLPAMLDQETPVLLLTSELDSLFLLAGTLAGKNAGLQLDSMAIDGQSEKLQQTWRIPVSAQRSTLSNPSFRIQDSGKVALTRLGEPAQWLPLLAYAVADQLSLGNLADRPKPDEMLNDIESEFAAALNDPAVFHRFSPGASPDTGLYWLAKPPVGMVSLTDRVEENIVRQLRTKPSLTYDDLHSSLYSDFCGILTPSDELIQAILESYAFSESLGETIVFNLLGNENAQRRADDMMEIRSLLEQIAARLKYRAETQADRISWFDQNNLLVYSIFPITSARISEILSQNQALPSQKIIAFPGSRSNLVAYKLKHDPNLRMLNDEKWQLIKFRQLRNLARNPLLSRELFTSQINTDPPEFHTAQLALF